MKIQLKLLMTTFLLLGSLVKGMAQWVSDDIIGVWYLEEFKSKIEVYRCGDKFCGKILESENVYGKEGKPLLRIELKPLNNDEQG